MQLISRHLTLFADYFQIYVCDAAFETDTGLLWDDATTDRMLAVGADLVAIGTARNMNVPVDLEVLDSAPVEDFDAWDQVIDCGVRLASGKLIAFGCTDDPDGAERLEVEAGDYAVRVSYAGLDQLSEDGLDGEDRYRVQLWRGDIAPPLVLKLRPG